MKHSKKITKSQINVVLLLSQTLVLPNTLLLTFRNTLRSRFTLAQFRLRAFRSQHTEKIPSTYAWEAGAATKSKANGDRNL